MLTRSCHAIVFSGFLPYVVVMGKFVIVLFVCDLCAYCLVKRGSARYLKDEIWGVQIGGLHNYLLDIILVYDRNRCFELNASNPT